MIELNINPLFQKALRPLTPDEYERLSENIQKIGCKDAIESWQGFILDGHNRYQICCETRQSFKVMDRTKDFETETDALAYIYELALARRNLTPSEFRGYLGDLYNAQKVKAVDKLRFDSDNLTVSTDTAKTLGEKFGVSERTVRRYGSEVERQKVLETLKSDVMKAAVTGGYSDDEDRMQEKFNEVAQGLQNDEGNEIFESVSDDYNQGEPTDDQGAAARAVSPFKRSKSKSGGVLSQQKAALKGYRMALDKIQGLRLDLLFDNSLELPGFAGLYASIDRAVAYFPVAKSRFGR